MTSTRTGHTAVDRVLEKHIDGLETALGDELVAVYLHGSLAHGGFGEHSDIDFLAIVRAEPSDECLGALRTHHRQLHDAEPPWSHRLEGSYAPIDEFAGPPARDGGWWYIDNGTDELARSRHDDTWVVRTTLVDDPVTLLGPEPSTIIGTIDRDALRDEIRTVMLDWGAELLGDAGPMETQWYQRFAAMSYARMLQSLQTGHIASKLAAGRWVQNHLEPRWAALVERAIATRCDPAESSKLPADPNELTSTHDFIRFAIASVADARQVVRAGYDAIADDYLAARDRSGSSADVVLLRDVLSDLPPSSRVLDVGCGAGDPVGRVIARAGHDLVGVDISETQLRLAQERLPDAEFIRGDVVDLEFDDGAFDLITAYFSVFHVPRDLHRDLFAKLLRWLRPGGRLVMTVGRTDSEKDVEPRWLGGAPMVWSHFDTPTTLAILNHVGFEIVEVRQVPEMLDNRGFMHPFVVARRS